MIALFRDYDVVWPGATNTALGWFEIVNVGLSMAAPGGLGFAAAAPQRWQRLSCPAVQTAYECAFPMTLRRHCLLPV